jgi:heptaprenyl diphosphate synthase
MSLASLVIKRDKLWVISVLGAIGHNIGQIAAAIFITGAVQIIGYFSILLVSAIITGFVTGIAAQLVMKRIELTGLITIKGKEL